ncbi:MAG: GntR family transcriptional regulator [Nocardioides sp.]
MTSISSSKGPLADSIQRELQAQIDAGRWQPGQRLGSERSLAMELGVSRSSLRQALAMMEQAGAVRRVIGRGGGTFVSRQKIDRDLSHIRSVPELLSAQGITAGTQILSTGMTPAAAATAEALEIEQGQLVYAIVRIRLADGAPISLEHAWLPVAQFPGLLDFQLGGSLYGLLAEHFGIEPRETTERIEVVRAAPTTPRSSASAATTRCSRSPGSPAAPTARRSSTRTTCSAPTAPGSSSTPPSPARPTFASGHEIARQSFELITR